jgi:hypothetical protein
MRRWSVVSLLAVGVVSAIVVAGCGSSGSSSGDPSGWSSSDIQKVESKVANAITEEGLTPSKAETSCVVRGYERMGASASQVLEDADASAEQEEEIKQFSEECLSGSAGTQDDSAEVEGSEELYEEAEEALSGPACQENVDSEACREEATEKEDEIAEREGLTPP